MTKKLIRYFPTQESLKISEEIAKKLGFDFDREKVSKLSLNLHETYFNEIISLLEIEPKELKFLPGSFRTVDAFADLSIKGEKTVFFDEHFDFWLMNLVHLNAITTFKVLQPEAYTQLAKTFELVLESTCETYLHKTIRRGFKELLFEHKDVLGFSHEFSKAMIVFIMCHEIAHAKLGHLQKKKDMKHEFEADALALDYFKKLVEHHEDATYVKFDERFLAAPVVLMNYFSVYERYLLKKYDQKPKRIEHPSPISRSDAIGNAIDFENIPPAKECLIAFMKGLKDITDELDLPLLTKRT